MPPAHPWPFSSEAVGAISDDRIGCTDAMSCAPMPASVGAGAGAGAPAAACAEFTAPTTSAASSASTAAAAAASVRLLGGDRIDLLEQRTLPADWGFPLNFFG